MAKSNWPEIDHRVLNDDAFRSACANGHLHIAQWLKNTWPEIDHQAISDYVSHYAREKGHLHIARWLKNNCPERNSKTKKITFKCYFK